MVAITGDNYATNVKLSKLVNEVNNTWFHVGCASHRFNLLVGDSLLDFSSAIDIVNRLMQKLKNLIPTTKMRRLTHLLAKTSCPTRWSSTFKTIVRFKNRNHFSVKLMMTI